MEKLIGEKFRESGIGALFLGDDGLAYEVEGRPREPSPEKALILAVLEDGIRTFVENARDSKGQNLFREAAEWIFADDRTWVFSFLSCCEALELDPDYLRGLCTTRLKEMLARRAA